VEVVKCDYRDATGTYDKVAAIAMLSHVGHRNLREFMRVAHDRCKPGGPVLIETIGSRVAKVNLEPWTDRYIFPGGVIPSLRQIERAYAGIFDRVPVIDFSRDYVPTLRTWNDNLESAWPELSSRYPETTRRMLRYYFLTCAAAFRAGHLKYWHIPLRRT
jgi:cyclopropane-fatty-acyl-phospholipid synthase